MKNNTCKRGPKPPRRDGWEAYLGWLNAECDCRRCSEEANR